MFDRIRTAVFPVAGLGTRFLPATKTVPKEMLPIVDRPLLQYAVDEAIAAGCETLVFVTNRYKHAVADYFDTAYELESRLEADGKLDKLSVVRNVLPASVQAVFVTQPDPLGLGDAVLRAASVVGNQPFAVLLPDDLIFTRGPGVLAQMFDEARRLNSAVIAVQNVAIDEVGSYGIAAVGADNGRSAPITALVEKPEPARAPSTLAVVGRYVLPGRIFELLKNTAPGRGGEIQLTDAIAALAAESGVYAFRYEGLRFDCGSHLGMVEATIHYALDHETLSEPVREAMARALDLLGVRAT